MKRLILGMAVGTITTFMTGCAALPVLPALLGTDPPPTLLTSTTVTQAQRNYRIVKANAVGISKGFKLLGIISLKSASYSKAATMLYKDAGVSEGRAQTLANVLHEKMSTFYILFSLPQVTVRADLIEFIDLPLTNQVDAAHPSSP
jgi:hypothetical protein